MSLSTDLKVTTAVCIHEIYLTVGIGRVLML